MAFPKLGPFGNIVEDFKKSLADIFQPSASGSSNSKISKLDLKDQVPNFDPKKWTGNNGRTGADALRYGFRVIAMDAISKGSFESSSNISGFNKEPYYLDIPPQAITQKENFATNIQATRRGVIVESEGIVFKDIIIQGTTGVFPGKRGSFGGSQANFSSLKDFTKPPAKKGGVSDDGRTASDTVLTGYEEFISLRAFFIKYAEQKVERRGDLFMVFINEKDQQALIVEPLEFTMERNSKAPMQYQYRIVLKCIANLDKALEKRIKKPDSQESVSTLTDIVNVSRNAVAAINQFRSAVGAANQLVRSTSQEIDKTFIQPLRLLGAALKDVSEARKNVLTSAAALKRNLNESLLSIEEARFDKTLEEMLKDVLLINTIKANFGTFTTQKASNISSAVQVGKISSRGTSDTMTSNTLLTEAKSESFIRSSVVTLEQSPQTPIPRSFVESLRNNAQKLADDMTDAVNLGNTNYDVIQNRIPTIVPNPLRVPTSNEFLALGATQKLISALDAVLATNNLFEPELQNALEHRQTLLQQSVVLQIPAVVQEITINGGDTLERIALREYGNAARWVDIAVLNNLKYPYIASVRSDGVKQYGDKLLLGN
jgi:nucleoid-associated protein YgaU